MDILKQTGFNEDTTCYPTNMCPRELEGYRWYYDLDTFTGVGMELSIGKPLRAYRVELAGVLASNDIRQTFDRITYLDGATVVPDENSEYDNSVESSVGSISFGGLMLNAYRDFQVTKSIPLTSYIGIGLGVTRVEVEELVFRAEYMCISDQCAGRQPSEYNVVQNTELSDWVWAINSSVGLDYEIGRTASVGLKITYRLTDDLVQSANYLLHPIPDLMNSTRVSELSSWSLGIAVKFKR